MRGRHDLLLKGKPERDVQGSLKATCVADKILLKHQLSLFF